MIEQHYRDNYERLVKEVLRRLDYKYELAEEAVQEAYTQAIVSFKGFNPEKDFEPWLRTILNRCCSKIAEQERNRGVVKEDISELEIPETAFDDDLRKMVLSVVGKIKDERNKHLLTLYYEFNYGPTDISKLLDMNVSAVTTIINRFKNDFVDRFKLYRTV